MQPNPDNEDTVLCADLIAPEGYVNYWWFRTY